MKWYVDPANGSNENSGHSMEHPLKDLSLFEYKGVNAAILNHGDKIYIKRGTSLQCDNVKLYANNFNLKVKPFVYLGAYGAGDNPKLTNHIEIKRSNLNQQSSNIYYIDLESDKNNVGFIYDEKLDRIYGNRVFNLNDLKNNMDFFINENRLHIYCNSLNAIPEIMKLPLAGTIMTTDANTIYENLHFTLGGSHGLATTEGGNFNIIVKNCRFDKLGGAKLTGTTRFGNGFEIFGNGYDIQVEKCIFEDIFDTGVTYQGNNATFKNISFNNNLFNKCNQACENWCNNETSGEGYINCTFNNNICLLSGYGFGGINRELGYHFMLSESNCNNTDITVKNNIFFKSKNGVYYIPELEKTKLKIINNKNYLYEDQINSVIKNNDDNVYLDRANKNAAMENVLLASDLFMNSIDKLFSNVPEENLNNEINVLTLESAVIDNVKSNSLTIIDNQVYINLKGKMKQTISAYNTFTYSNQFKGYTCEQQYINDDIYVNIANGQLYLQANKDLPSETNINISGVFTIKEQ